MCRVQEKYGVQGIPWLVVLNAHTGELIDGEGDAVLGNKDAQEVFDAWIEEAKGGKAP